MADQGIAARATAAQSHHLGIGGVSSTNTSRAGSNMPALASNAFAPAPHPRASTPPRAGFF